jgi:hypothetical protein
MDWALAREGLNQGTPSDVPIRVAVTVKRDEGSRIFGTSEDVT